MTPRRQGIGMEVGSQEIPGVTGMLGLGVQNEVGQRLTEFCQENALVRKHPLPTTRDDYTHEHSQMVNTEIRMIILPTAKGGRQCTMCMGLIAMLWFHFAWAVVKVTSTRGQGLS